MEHYVTVVMEKQETKPASHIGNAVASIYYLFNSFYLKLVWISLLAHIHLSHSHFV